MYVPDMSRVVLGANSYITTLVVSLTTSLRAPSITLPLPLPLALPLHH